MLLYVVILKVIIIFMFDAVNIFSFELYPYFSISQLCLLLAMFNVKIDQLLPFSFQMGGASSQTGGQPRLRGRQ
jgi:hypothetical protein